MKNTSIDNLPLVTLVITVERDGKTVTSDLQTHDNSFAEVLVGLVAIRKEIDRVFAERKKCPYYPRNKMESQRKIVRCKSSGEEK